MNNKSILLSIIFILILISVTVIILSSYEIDDEINYYLGAINNNN